MRIQEDATTLKRTHIDHASKIALELHAMKTHTDELRRILDTISNTAGTVNDKFDTTSTRIQAINHQLSLLEQAIKDHTKILKGTVNAVSLNRSNIEAMKSQVKEIRENVFLITSRKSKNDD